MRKNIIIFIITLLLILFFSGFVNADNCGGTRRCHCGDTLVESQIMWYDLIDCSEEGLTIVATNITLNCNGHLIDGDGSGIPYHTGIGIGAISDSITNCNVQEFYFGILIFKMSYNNLITHNTVNNNNWFGIYLSDFSENNIISNNIVNYNGGAGIYLSASDNNVVSGNAVSNNIYYGLLVNSNNNDIYNNIFTDNYINAYAYGDFNNWNVSDMGNSWSDFRNNPGYPYYYEIPGPGNGIDWHPIWEDVWITLIPTGITTFPASGGILEYNITGGNNEPTNVILDIWVDVTLPNGHPYGPVVGPVLDFNMRAYPWQTNVNRELNIPARAPAGTYTINAYLGEYDAVNPIIYAESHFNFIKEGTERDSKFKLVDSGGVFLI